MPKTLSINLPVADVARSTALYQAIGFEDPDGHGFRPFPMDVAAFEAAQQQQTEAA